MAPDYISPSPIRMCSGAEHDRLRFDYFSHSFHVALTKGMEA